MKEICCALHEKRSTIVIDFNAEGRVLSLSSVGRATVATNEGGRKMATQIESTAESVMYVDSVLAKSPNRHLISKGLSTKRKEKQKFSKELFGGLSTLQEKAAENKTKVAENEAKWEKKEEEKISITTGGSKNWRKKRGNYIETQFRIDAKKLQKRLSIRLGRRA